jgi:lipoate-protein ligase B
VGVAVRDWVAYHGLIVNLQPDLTPFKRIRTGGAVGGAMTSVERERHGPVRPAHFRERFLEHFQSAFGFARTSLFFQHPVLTRAGGTSRTTVMAGAR